ncbi:MAG: hypothetical protein ACT6FF_00310 [Methanosarcinaceae archaeon]
MHVILNFYIECPCCGNKFNEQVSLAEMGSERAVKIGSYEVNDRETICGKCKRYMMISKGRSYSNIIIKRR